ncbi:hypothetical protein GCM10027215_34050 [Nocardioides zeae]
MLPALLQEVDHGGAVGCPVGRGAARRDDHEDDGRHAAGASPEIPHVRPSRGSRGSRGATDVRIMPGSAHDLASTRGCLPRATNRIGLGYCPDCSGAVSAAKQYYADVDGCSYCANACHTS